MNNLKVQVSISNPMDDDPSRFSTEDLLREVERRLSTAGSADNLATKPGRKQTPRLTIADLATCGRALTVADLEQVFSVHKVTLYKMARKGRIPGAFRIGTCLRFDPRQVAAGFIPAVQRVTKYYGLPGESIQSRRVRDQKTAKGRQGCVGFSTHSLPTLTVVPPTICVAVEWSTATSSTGFI